MVNMVEGQYTVTSGSKRYPNLAFGAAIDKIRELFEHDHKSQARIHRQP